VRGNPDRERIRNLVHRYFDLHSRREWSGLVEMFTPDVTLTHPVYPQSSGRDAVGRFFTDYIPSRFRTYFEYASSVIVEDNKAAAEWIFEVIRLDGQAATLRGVTVLEFQGERIKTIRIFLDPTQLGNPRG
jgi:ketosteroid isomerase-like protein